MSFSPDDDRRPPAPLVLTPPRRPGTRGQKPRRRYMVVDLDQFLGLRDGIDARRRVGGSHHGRILVLATVRVTMAKSEAQALSQVRWWIRRFWRQERPDDPPPDPTRLAAIEEDAWDSLRLSRTIEGSGIEDFRGVGPRDTERSNRHVRPVPHEQLPLRFEKPVI